jgi:peptidoglycan hydrolase-like protein with peptidoglycan-binding domain
MRKKIAAATLTAAAAVTTLGLNAGSASANPAAGWVGYGQTNNAHAVWCVQKLIDDSPAPYYTPTDGVFGQDTYNAIEAFQSWAGLKPVDGTVGPATGYALLHKFSDYYDNYCWTYLPTPS